VSAPVNGTQAGGSGGNGSKPGVAPGTNGTGSAGSGQTGGNPAGNSNPAGNGSQPGAGTSGNHGGSSGSPRERVSWAGCKLNYFRGGPAVADIRGIREHVDHRVALGVDAVWLSPFYPSPQVDAGYDVSDYFDLAPEYGSLEDLDALIADLHAVGIRIVIDLVPNHSSDQHEWFRAALEAADTSTLLDITDGEDRIRFYVA